MAALADNSALVLHIEDDAPVRASVASFLTVSGHRVLSATDGSSAVAVLQARAARPDVLIIDFNLPGDMDGSDAAEAIYSLLGYAVPTIVLSGELANAALPWMTGAPLFCVWKPANPEILLAVVEAFAALGRAIRTHTSAAAA